MSDQPIKRDLCTLEDIRSFIPGYEPDDQTELKLAQAISSRSRSIHQTAGREFVSISDEDPRVFDLSVSICQRRALPIGDAATVTQVELFDYDGTTSLGVIDPGLYVLDPRVREEWEPITRLRFPYRPSSALLLAPGRTLAVTGIWGFPQIPDDIRQACAALVVTTMLTDVAQAGTDLSDAIDPNLNIGGLIRYSLDTIQSYAGPGFA